jgi:hypothetical protein
MIFGRIGWEPGILTLLCILTIFFFPAAHGPYSTVHGPVTALQAARQAARTKIAIMQTARCSLRGCVMYPGLGFSWWADSGAESQSLRPSEPSAILRC